MGSLKSSRRAMVCGTWAFLIAAKVGIASVSVVADEISDKLVDAKEAGKRAVDVLIPLLGSPSFTERERATRELVAHGARAIEPLKAAQHASSDLELRTRAGRILSELTRRGAHRPLPPPFDPKRVGKVIEVGGELVKDETWTAGATYLVTRHLKIGDEKTLTIERGVTVLFKDGVDFVVTRSATLVAQGGSGQDGILLAADAERRERDGYWGAFSVYGKCTLRHVQVRRCQGLRLHRSLRRRSDHLLLESCGFFHIDGDAITLGSSTSSDFSAQMTGITVREAKGVGMLFAAGNSSTLSDVKITGARCGMRFVGGAHPSMRDISIGFCRDTGFEIREQSNPKVQDLFVEGSVVGILAVDQSYGQYSGVTVGESDHGLVIDNGSYPYFRDGLIRACRTSGVLVRDDVSTPTFENVDAKDCNGAEWLIHRRAAIRKK
jgi:hypothetical protein